MATIIQMPAVVADAEDAVLTSWLVATGESVTKGQALAEIETDKANVEVTSDVAGTVGRLLATPSQRVAVGAPICAILAAGEDPSAVDVALGAQPAPAQSAPPPEPAAVAVAATTSGGEPVRTDGTRVFASPLARRIAAEHGVDIGLVQGRGPRGRVIRADVEAYLEASAQAVEAPVAAAAQSAAVVPQPAATPQATFAAEPAPSAGGAYVDVPLTGMRRAIARRLTQSKTTVPHWYVTVDVRMDALLAYRKQLNAVASVKISVNDLIIKAIAGALQALPAANAVWNGDSIRQYSTVDVSVAVSTDKGLVTPVVRGVERLGLEALARTTQELIERARANKLKQDEIEGGSFSISNLGMYGVREFAAILNPPQSGILAVGAAEQRPVVIDGELAAATVMTVTLSSDHRVVDGALAAQLLQALKARLENPALMAL